MMLQLLARYNGTPYRYGETDCACLAGDIIKIVSGRHPWPDAVGAYDTLEGGAAWLRSRGYTGLLALLRGRVPNAVRIRERYAFPGDVAVVRGPIGHTFAIVWGGHLLGRSPGHEGLVNLDHHASIIHRIMPWPSSAQSPQP